MAKENVDVIFLTPDSTPKTKALLDVFTQTFGEPYSRLVFITWSAGRALEDLVEMGAHRAAVGAMEKVVGNLVSEVMMARDWANDKMGEQLDHDVLQLHGVFLKEKERLISDAKKLKKATRGTRH